MKYPMRSEYLSSARNDALEEFAFKRGSVWSNKDAKRFNRTNPSTRISKMDEKLAIYHKKSETQPISFVYAQFLGRDRF
jgi:hypothetical protein